MKYGVVIRSAWIANDVSLTINPFRTIITYSAHLPPALAHLGVVTMIEVLALRWPGSQFRFRYPLPNDDAELRHSTTRSRRDYRIPEKRAVKRLLPDELLERADREEWPNWMLVEASKLDEPLCQKRVREWRESRDRQSRIGTFHWDGPIPF